jgi:hypothetical protein
MRVRSGMLVWGCVTLLAWQVGCGGSSEKPAATPEAPTAPPAATPDSNSTSGKAAAPVNTLRFAQPDETVRQFLTALKSGDQPRATSMLSVKAQQEMARTEASIRPPGSNTAVFAVSAVEYVGADQSGAQVLSTWTDQESAGKATHEIVWLLRKETAGWAIAGMATTVFEDQPPLILNFEDPLEAQRKRTEVDAEIARRQTPGDATPDAAKTR